jgi:very-short-patch-repair endonuclease
METDSERIFAERVLSMPELAAWEKQPQKPITVAGRTYRPDFVLTHGMARIVIEIDLQGPTRDRHDSWSARQNALASAGYEVLRFSNRQVREVPEQCRRDLLRAVARLEERERHRQAAPGAAAQEAPRASAAPAASPVAAAPTGRSRELHRVLVTGMVAGVVLLAGVIAFLALRGNKPGVQPIDDGRGVGFVTCPADHPYKGNVSASGEKIVHRPGSQFYDRTKPERCFVSLSEAAEGGFRPAT